MPGLNGLELVQCAHAVRPELKTVLITGHLPHKAKADAERAGVNAILAKPFTLDELSQTIRAALAGGTSS